jgi:hypothetical protein
VYLVWSLLGREKQQGDPPRADHEQTGPAPVAGPREPAAPLIGRSGLRIRTAMGSLIQVNDRDVGLEVVGSGQLATKPREVAGFSAITLKIVDARVTVLQAENDEVTLTAEDNVLPFLTTKVTDDTLTVGFAEGSNLNLNRPVIIDVRVKALRRLRLHQNETVKAEGVKAESLEVAILSNGTVTASGRAEELKLTMPRTCNGAFHGAGLATKLATLDLESTGRAEVNASDQLDVTFGGFGTVRYVDWPQVKLRRLGPGNGHLTKMRRDEG